jgi:hypothetical protein
MHPKLSGRKRRLRSKGGAKTKRMKRMKQTKQTKRMKGGLGPYDSLEIHMPERYSFRKPSMIDEFKLHVFGSDDQRVAWETLLTECNNRGVPVYILSAGDKIGIIRMLQLMNLDHAFEEVLCTNPNENTKPNEQPNPESDNGLHNFQGYTKYNVIRAILRENYDIPAPGCLMDDNPNNAIDQDKASTIKFVNVHTVEQTPTKQPGNIFYSFIVDNKSLQLQPLIASRWFADVDVINYVTELVINGTYKIVFIDFDRTFQQWSGAIPFWRSNVIAAFHDRFKISTTRLYRLY